MTVVEQTLAIELAVVIEQIRMPEIEDGDVHSVALTRSDGSLLAAREWTATYSESYPNGEHCPSCVHAELTAIP